MSQETNEPTAVLLIAHGSRRQEANDDLVHMAESVQASRGELIVEIAYLEIAEPTIPQGAGACVRRGAKQVFLLPYFLSPGNHVAGDLERFRGELSQKYSDVVFQLCRPLGAHPLLTDIVLDRFDEEAARTT